MTQKTFIAKIQRNAAGLGPRQIRAIVSTGCVDRMGDVVTPSGLKGGSCTVPLLIGHDASKLPIGKAELRATSTYVEALITFLDSGTYDQADIACAGYKQGIYDSFSIGFNPLASTPRKNADGTRGVTYTSWECLELSCVAVPANPEARVTQRALIGPDAHRNSSAAKAARRAKAAEIQRRVAAEDAGAGLPIDPARMTREQAERIVKAERLANGETWEEVNAPTTRPMTEQERASKRAAEAFLRLDANTPEARLRKAAALAEDPGVRERRVREAELALAQRQAFQRQYRRDAT